jgi:hypothetical protein
MAVFRDKSASMTVMAFPAPPEDAAAPGGPPAQPPITTISPGTVAAASGSAVAAQFIYGLVAAIVFGAGLLIAVGLFGDAGGPVYTAAEGLGAFALFYVVAQACERLVEFITPVFDKIDGKANLVKQRDAAAAAASKDRSQTSAESAAKKQDDLDQLRENRRIITFGLTAALGMALCGYLEADFLNAVGVDFGTSTTSEWLRMAVTGLVIGGGSAKLHDLITNMTKKSAAQSDPEETGGTK